MPAEAGPWAAVVTIVAAGGLHVAAAVDHLGAGILVVGFFLATALLQWALAVLLTVSYWRAVLSGPPVAARPAPVWVLLAIAATAALVALYVVVHTTDLLGPLAAGGHAQTGLPHPLESSGPVSLGEPAVEIGEPIDALGMITVAVELGTVGALTALLPARWRAATTDALLALSLLIWVLWLAAGTT